MYLLVCGFVGRLEKELPKVLSASDSADRGRPRQVCCELRLGGPGRRRAAGGHPGGGWDDAALARPARQRSADRARFSHLDAVKMEIFSWDFRSVNRKFEQVFARRMHCRCGKCCGAMHGVPPSRWSRGGGSRRSGQQTCCGAFVISQAKGLPPCVAGDRWQTPLAFGLRNSSVFNFFTTSSAMESSVSPPDEMYARRGITTSALD